MITLTILGSFFNNCRWDVDFFNCNTTNEQKKKNAFKVK